MDHITEKIESIKNRLGFIHNPMVAWLILLFSVTVTIIAYLYSTKITEERIADRFTFRAQELVQSISDRIQIYEQVLWSGVALFDASEEVTRSEWQKFVGTLKIEEHWPGIQGMGFAIPLDRQQVDEHIAAIRAEGFEAYRIYPEFDRDFYTSIIFLEPFDWRNQRAFGYDMWSNDLRRKAMRRSRDLGVATLSGMITLVQETSQDTQYGFLSYVPVYQKGADISNTEGRRKNFIGWVYAPFRIKDFLQGILGQRDTDIAFAIYDGKNATHKKLMFANEESYRIDEKGKTNVTTDNQLWHTVENQGRPWTFHFYQVDDPEAEDSNRLPQMIALLGLALDVVLFYVIVSLHLIAKHTDSAIKERTRGLLKDKETLEQAFLEEEEKHKKALEELNKQVANMQEREERVIELKKEVNALAKAAGREPPYTAGVD